MAFKNDNKVKSSFNKISIGLASPEEILKLFFTLLSFLKAITFFPYSKLILKPKPRSSCNNTLSDSGIPGAGIGSPFTIAS